MALEFAEPKAGGDAFLDGAARDVEELDQLVGDLILTARLGSSQERKREPIDLAELAGSEGARVDATVRGSGATVGNPSLVRLALRNLLLNAHKHGGGAVECEVDGATVAVLDRGPGVPTELRERIFEPFYRPEGHDEGRDGGVGLGLALVREIAEHHGGSVACEPRPGGGSRFVLRLAAP
jgi:signal transduction histidine kinase